MQSLQKTVLNKIQPGIIPVFIIAPNKSDGDDLATLLSENIIFKNDEKFAHLVTSSRKNYFSNADTRRVLPITADANDKKAEDHKAIIKLLMDEGFDNRKLWGLQLDFELFFELRVNLLFPYATFIFLYGTKTNKVVTTYHKFSNFIAIIRPTVYCST
jgi:hypothetical protein